ncbi:hypothetical protein IE53DRAFT_382949 [Violaceomyces palustris]|uniref:Uncharacterized protein n=1 Tax=Violaceomyces palustris TaxID=1673888 RepID=A0ACD0P8J4_9BASI|nr:hypothetical protein IE53DRAFT_382949 [Violaceomyces palustris]
MVRINGGSRPSEKGQETPQEGIKIVEGQELDFGSLIRELSKPENLASALHVRNTLLSAYNGSEAVGSKVLAERERSEAQDQGVDGRPWDTLLEYLGPGSKVWAFGRLPRLLFSSHNRREREPKDPTHGRHVSHDEEEQSEEQQEGRAWGILISEFRFRKYGRGRPPRIHLWVSSQSRIPIAQEDGERDGGDDGPCPNRSPPSPSQVDSSQALDTVRRLLIEFLPQQLSRSKRWLEEVRSTDLEAEPQRRSAEEAETLPVVICGLERIFGDHLKILCSSLSSSSSSPRAGYRFEVEWENPCLIYLRSEVRICKAYLSQFEVEGRGCKIDTISERDVEMITRSNKLPFPAEMVRDRSHISTMIRSVGSDPSQASKGEDDPDDQMGWAYAHEDLAVASLFVRQPFRRIKVPFSQTMPENSTSPPPPSPSTSRGLGVGQLVIDSLGEKLVRCNLEALRCCGLRDLVVDRSPGSKPRAPQPPSPSSPLVDVAPLCCVTEEENLGAQAFFERLGFQFAGRNVWMGLTFHL